MTGRAADVVSQPHILIVGDRAPATDELGRQVTELGYTPEVMSTSEAPKVFRTTRTPPDLVLVDVAPGRVEDAVGSIADLRGRRSTPVVLMIAESDEAELERAPATEGVGYVVKPCRTSELGVNIELAVCKLAAADLVRETEDRFFAASIEMLCYLDFDGYFKRLNPQWERTLGWTLEELMSRPFIEFVHPEDRERTLEQNALVRAGGKARAFENRYLCKDGSYRWFLWNAAPDAPGRTVYSVARDITDRKRAEEEREELVVELKRALSEVRALRTILPICSYCRKIRDDEDYWHTVEAYISRHTTTRFSHGICPSCVNSEVEPQFEALDGDGSGPNSPSPS